MPPLNKLFLVPFLALLMSTGCVLYAEDGYGYDYGEVRYPGDVTLHWSFVGQSCSDFPEVKSLAIRIPGERLQNEGIYPCTANGFAGIVLHDFEPGTYDFTIDALDYSGDTLFVGDGDFTIDGDVRVNIDLTPAGGPNSYAYLTWRFPENSESTDPSCSQAGVSYVDVRIDGEDAGRFNCGVGQGYPGIQTPYLNPGSHSIELTAKSADGYPYYSYKGTLQTFAGDPISAEYSLHWAVGGVAIRWELRNTVAKTCAEAGVQTVTLNFEDSQGHLIYGPTGDPQACGSAPIVYDYLLPGTYRVYLQGSGSGGTYLSDAVYPQTVTIRAGVFADEGHATTVVLHKK